MIWRSFIAKKNLKIIQSVSHSLFKHHRPIMALGVLFSGSANNQVKLRAEPPACLNDPQYGTHKYIKLKSIKIHYVEAGDKSNPLMIFLHGFPEFWYSWRHQIKEFKKTHWVVAIDMRGYGDSDKPEGVSSYSAAEMVEDIRELVEGLGRTSCILVAHDWGGVIGWYLTMKYPELVQKFIVMNSPHPEAFRIHLRTSLKQLRMSWYMFFFQLPYLPEKMLRQRDLVMFDMIYKKQIYNPNAISADDIEAYKYTFGKKGAFTPPLNYYRNSLRNFVRKPPQNKIQPKISLPVLIIWGEKDEALHNKLVELARPYLEDCTIKTIPQAGHWVQQDAVDLVNKYMSDFLFGASSQ